MVTATRFHDFVREQAQGPARIAVGCSATGQRRDFCSLRAIDDDRSPGPGRVIQAVQAMRAVAMPPRCNRGVVHVQGGGNRAQRLAVIQFEYGRRTLKGLNGKRARGQPLFQSRAVSRGQVRCCRCIAPVYTINTVYARKLSLLSNEYLRPSRMRRKG